MTHVEALPALAGSVDRESLRLFVVQKTCHLCARASATSEATTQTTTTTAAVVTTTATSATAPAATANPAVNATDAATSATVATTAAADTSTGATSLVEGLMNSLSEPVVVVKLGVACVSIGTAVLLLMVAHRALTMRHMPGLVPTDEMSMVVVSKKERRAMAKRLRQEEVGTSCVERSP
eukprot:CAMPEP_0181174244 /NCGR_PEP_ID=MMETSP1096-20121128/3431_1 /TAXON_ID=156174 ORGANISM="Chrysochromulina ericina, Strain CCMP281" /NCGR_SAMPLE_ID=MMETSP1096 /ASSEMBLY_ACC=CAM_ASM_000453 /LENGTH=179 /DNA_ID=CAMNT_0023262129 /DNA_START=94 /DNA_END=635 /DNA_ORIENTATION=+